MSPSASSENESSDEEEATLPPAKRKRKAKAKPARNNKKAKPTFESKWKYYPSTKFNTEWDRENRQNYFNAQRTYWNKGTKESMADEAAKLKEKQQRRAANK